MKTAQDVLVVLHLLGFAALFGGAIVQVRDRVRVVNVAMLYGAGAQIVTGLLLVGVLENLDEPVNHAKILVKLLIALAVVVLCWENRARPRVPAGLFTVIWVLTLANVCVAVFW